MSDAARDPAPQKDPKLLVWGVLTVSALHQGRPCHQAQAGRGPLAEQQLPAQGGEALAWKTRHLCKSKGTSGLQLPQRKAEECSNHLQGNTCRPFPTQGIAGAAGLGPLGSCRCIPG